MHQLRQKLERIERKPYKAYKEIQGRHRFDHYTLSVDHVQGDPFAAPSRISIQIDHKTTGIPAVLWCSRSRRIALEDFLSRQVSRSIKRHSKGDRGSGKSGAIHIEYGNQELLARSALLVNPDSIDIRLTVGLPAAGRSVLAKEAIAIFFQELPRIIEQGVMMSSLEPKALRQHLAVAEDQAWLRRWLLANDKIAFVVDGAILPRHSGVDDRPLTAGAVPFKAPESLACRVTLPNAGEIRGMAIPPGVTLIVGGGFHGKSTLLNALERGVYDHIPGDGREFVVTRYDAVKIRAEDGRVINKVDITPFINHLPFGKDTCSFSTENASGSTSQAANIIEALHTGARTLLIDEDTSATNFMIRDRRMQALVSADKEPITPLVQRIRELYTQQDVSVVMVMGGSGDYFEVADTVIMLDDYQVRDVSDQARALAGNHLDGLSKPAPLPATLNGARRPGRRVLDAARGNRDVKLDIRELRQLHYGEHRIDLNNVEQLVNMGQTRAIGWIMHYYANHYAHNNNPMIENLRDLFSRLQALGLDLVTPYKLGNLALPRLYEVAAAINRIRCNQWH